MKINLTGTTRIVIELNSIVIKIPNFTHSWIHFLKGLVGNITEGKVYKLNTGPYQRGYSHLLCPVVFSSWGGWVLVMKKADRVLTYDEFWSLDEKVLSQHLKHFSGDDTGPNYGWLNGRLVKIDYAGIN